MDRPLRRGRRLRAGLAALTLILMAPAVAVAADMPDFLRGSYTPTDTRWEGFYVGGQAGETFGSADFSNATQSMLNYILSNTELQETVSG
jgi:opacity protein-like surface antigen